MQIIGKTKATADGWDADVEVGDEFAYTEHGETEQEAKKAAEAVAKESDLGEIKWEKS